MANPPTLWAHFEAGELVNVEERLADLCCAPLEAVRYEAFDKDRDNATRLALLEEIRDICRTNGWSAGTAVACVSAKYAPAEPGQESK